MEGKIGLFREVRVSKTIVILIIELINNIAKALGISVFSGMIKLIREGSDFYMEMIEFEVINEESITKSKVTKMKGCSCENLFHYLNSDNIFSKY